MKAACALGEGRGQGVIAKALSQHASTIYIAAMQAAWAPVGSLYKVVFVSFLFTSKPNDEEEKLQYFIE